MLLRSPEQLDELQPETEKHVVAIQVPSSHVLNNACLEKYSKTKNHQKEGLTIHENFTHDGRQTLHVSRRCAPHDTGEVSDEQCAKVSSCPPSHNHGMTGR